ncbi:MAG: hypothetical protein WA821_24150, partial [Anaerolineales bacterium]
MRPVDRGAHPQKQDGSLVEFLKYQDAKPHLIKQLGEYCSYCEMQLSSALAVEHMLPQLHNPK